MQFVVMARQNYVQRLKRFDKRRQLKKRMRPFVDLSMTEKFSPFKRCVQALT